MRRVLFIVQGASGGVSRHLVDLISNLDRSKYQIGIVFNSKFEDRRFSDWRSTESNINFFNLPSLVRNISPRRDFIAILDICKVIGHFKPDIVHAHSSKAGYVGRVAARIMKTRLIIYTPHAYAFLSPEFSRSKRFIFTIAERFLSRLFTDITINCSYSEHDEAMKKHIDVPKKFIVIPNAVVPIKHIDPVRQKARLGQEEQVKIVGTMARVSPQKNPSLFEKIAMETSKIDTSIKFIWVGSNPQNRRSSFVDYLGTMQNTQQLVAGFDLYLSTSLFEGLSYSLLEASNVGDYVLASDVPGNNEFIEQYSGAHGFELSDSPKKIALDVVKMLNQYNGKVQRHRGGDFESFIDQVSRLYSCDN